MRLNSIGSALGVFAVLACALPAAGENWLKIMADDPYSKEGSFHMFDVDSAFEDPATGLVAARMTYARPETVAKEGVAAWYVWAFDCVVLKVYYVSKPAEQGSETIEGWRDKPNSLAAPLMGGVTNAFGKKLCALKGSWPQGRLP